MSSYRYKARGTIITDKNGTPDTVEFLNIAQDDALSWPRMTHRTYPSIVNGHMEDTFIPFVQKSMAINQVFMSFFERRLQLPAGALTQLHSPDAINGGETRCVRTPPNQDTAGIGAHTDFGSLVSFCKARRTPSVHKIGTGNCTQPFGRAPGDAPEL